MTTNSKRIKRGNTSPLWRVGVQAYDSNGLPITGQFVDLSSNYECNISVPTAVPPIEREVTTRSADDTRFLVQLTPVETATLMGPNHIVAIEVSNSTLTPPFIVETHVQLLVDDDIIN